MVRKRFVVLGNEHPENTGVSALLSPKDYLTVYIIGGLIDE